MAIVGAILALSLLVVVHEMGHFLVARWCKMKVECFSLGFGPAIAKKKWFGTTFQIGPIPFGGYVWVHGMNPVDDIDPDDPYAYPNRPVWQRFLVILAGPMTNILFAILLGLIYFTTWGAHQRRVVTAVGQDSAAAGIVKVGDEIVAYNGTPVYHVYDGWPSVPLPAYVQKGQDNEATLSVIRDGERLDFQITPKQVTETYKSDGEEKKRHVYRLGIGIGDKKRVPALGTEIRTAFIFPYRYSARTIEILHEKLSKREKPDMRGPPGMVDELGKAIRGGFESTILLLMIINVALGLFNLFPIPALDGGRLVFLGYEMITRRRANQRIETYVHMIGVFFLIALIVMVTVDDCARIL